MNRTALVYVTLTLTLAPAVVSAQQGPRAPQRYVTRANDTCVAIARRVYGDSRMTTLIHQGNPTMGPPPHRLRAGTALTLLPRPAGGNAPDALLTAVHNTVQVLAPASRAGQRNDPLYRGMRVNTEERSSAEVTFADETQLQLQERTLIVILGETSSRVQRSATARDTVLERGALTAFLAGLDRQRAGGPPAGAAPTSINTAAGRVSFDRGTNALLEVDASRRTTLSVFRGGSRVQQRRQRVAVPQGFGVRATPNQPIPPPRMLPRAPVWITAPAPLALTDRDSATVVAEVSPAIAPAVLPPPALRPPEPARWRVQAARDERFNELVADVRGPASQTRIEIPNVEPGTLYLRVSAIDADEFQGAPSAVMTAVVARAVVAASQTPHRGTVTVTAGTFCALDGAPLVAMTDAPLDFDRLHPHTLRCAASASGEGAVEQTLAVERLGPLRLEARLQGADAAARTATVRLRVLDGVGVPVARERLGVASSAADVTAREPSAAGGGEYDVPVTWTRGATAVALRVTVDDEHGDTSAVFLPEEPAAPERPHDRWYHRLSVRVEGGGAFMLSEYQSSTDRSSVRFDGNAPALGGGYGGQGRVALQLLRPDGGSRGAALALELGGGYWRFIAGEATTLDPPFSGAGLGGAGLRLEPFAGRWRFYVDAHAYAAFTGSLVRLGLDAGAGLDIPLGASFALGPFVRYLHIIEPGDAPTDEDARTITGGVSFVLRPASARW